MPAPSRSLHFFPDYTAGNPYQAMLHAGLGEVDACAVPVTHLVRHLREAASAEDPGVLSVHWTVPILQWTPGPFRARLVLDRLRVALDGYRAAGGRLVWTIHNVLPHDARHRWAEVELAALLADRADQVQVLSPETLDAVRGVYEVDPAKVVVIEHASYLGVYPDTITAADARRRLGVEPGETVLLALGGIRPYKGLDALLDVFDTLLEPQPGLRLLLAGRPVDEEVTADLRARCERHPRVLSRFEQVPDDELQVWFRAADLAVLPYRDILNSGAFLLAPTFDLPVVAPRAGSLGRWEDEPHVWLFDPQVEDSLLDTTRRALDGVAGSGPEVRAAARAFAERFAPDAMAAQFARAVEPLLGPR